MYIIHSIEDDSYRLLEDSQVQCDPSAVNIGKKVLFTDVDGTSFGVVFDYSGKLKFIINNLTNT